MVWKIAIAVALAIVTYRIVRKNIVWAKPLTLQMTPERMWAYVQEERAARDRMFKEHA